MRTVESFVSRYLLAYWWTWTVLVIGSVGSSTSAVFATVSMSVSIAFVQLLILFSKS